MIRQYYRKKFKALVTWLAIDVLFLRFLLLIIDGKNYKNPIELYQIICYPDAIAFFFFPAFLFYCLFEISFFIKPEIMYRCTSIKKAWRKIKETIFLDSFIFVFLFQIMTFVTYLLLSGIAYYLIILPYLILSFLMQCVTAYAFALLFMVLYVILHNTAFGFLISMLIIIGEGLFLHISGGVPVYFLGGMNFQPAYYMQGNYWQAVVFSVFTTAIFLSCVGPLLLRKHDYLLSKRDKE